MPDRTVRVDVLTVRPKHIPEPDWCAGHDPDRAQFHRDLLHTGPDVPLTFQGRTLSVACLTQAPYACRATRQPRVSVSLVGAELDAQGVYRLAAALETYAEQLRGLADELLVILAGEDQ
ncbi:DUF6907 domain-containing protein [Streptomyces sp. NPDC056568]|uniref:DUF6907 domain-containing protein n=1 Tax=Streptomyces sp. NPDC056568 TaxID=3345866 RepID=UPI0036C9AC78